MERLLSWTDEKQMLDQNVRKRLNPDPAQMVGLVMEKSLLEGMDSQNQIQDPKWNGNNCTVSDSFSLDVITY